MKISKILLILTISNFSYSMLTMKSSKEIDDAYINYLNKYKKKRLFKYERLFSQFQESPFDYNFRKRIFEDNLMKIELNNRKKEKSWEAGLNIFTDMTEEEVKNYTGLGNIKKENKFTNFSEKRENLNSNLKQDNSNIQNFSKITSPFEIFKLKSNTPCKCDNKIKVKITPIIDPITPKNPFPKNTLFSDMYKISNSSKHLSKDWVFEKKVTTVKNQGSCGSCWAYATLAALESAFLIQQNKVLNLSEQNLVDCSPYNCSGGWLSSTYDWMIKGNTVLLENFYPYKERNGRCKGTTLDFPKFCDNFTKKIRFGEFCKGTTLEFYDFCYNLTNYVNIQNGDMLSFLKLLYKQPVTVGITATSELLRYKNGIFNVNTRDRNDHAVLAVGFFIDEKNFANSWVKLKNSWGTGWGEDGFFRIKLENFRYSYGMLRILENGKEVIAPNTL